MIFVSKEYEIKIKMVARGAITTAEIDVFIFFFYWIELTFDGNKNSVGRGGMSIIHIHIIHINI